MNVQAENCSVKSICSGYRLDNDMVLNTKIYQPSQSRVGSGFRVSCQGWGFTLMAWFCVLVLVLGLFF